MGFDRKAFRKDALHLGNRRALLRAAYYRASAVTSIYAYRLVVLTPDAVRRPVADLLSVFSIRPLNVDELASFSRDSANLLSPELVAQGEARGDTCIGVLDGSELASFCWYSQQPTVLEDGTTVHFPRHHAYAFHGYTKPAYRGKDLLGHGLTIGSPYFAEHGVNELIGLVDWANYASLASVFRTGFQTRGFAMRWERGGRSSYWTSPGCRRLGVQLQAGGERSYA